MDIYHSNKLVFATYIACLETKQRMKMCLVKYPTTSRASCGGKIMSDMDVIKQVVQILYADKKNQVISNSELKDTYPQL